MKNYTVYLKSVEESDLDNQEHNGWVEYVEAATPTEAEDIAIERVLKAVEQPNMYVEAIEN